MLYFTFSVELLVSLASATFVWLKESVIYLSVFPSTAGVHKGTLIQFPPVFLQRWFLAATRWNADMQMVGVDWQTRRVAVSVCVFVSHLSILSLQACPFRIVIHAAIVHFTGTFHAPIRVQTSPRLEIITIVIISGLQTDAFCLRSVNRACPELSSSRPRTVLALPSDLRRVHSRLQKRGARVLHGHAWPYCGKVRDRMALAVTSCHVTWSLYVIE